MNREIKFRGKRVDSDEWVYGFYMEGVTENKKYFIFADLFSKEFVQVDPEIVGQFTGLLDKNKREIYEGDILKDAYGDLFQSTYYGYMYGKSKLGHVLACNIPSKIESEFEVIGNIHDNPELVK